MYAEYTDAVEALDDDGTVAVPDGPGLGVDYNWDRIEDHATEMRAFD